MLIRAHNTNANCHTSYICSCAITDANGHTSDICSCAVSCLPWSPPSGCNDQPYLTMVCAPLFLWMLVVCGPLPLEVLLVFASLFVNVLLVRVPVPGSWLALLANSSAPQDSLTTRARTLQNLPRMRCKALLNLLWIRTHSQSHIGAMGTAPLPLRCVTGLCRSASLDFSGLCSCPLRAYFL